MRLQRHVNRVFGRDNVTQALHHDFRAAGKEYLARTGFYPVGDDAADIHDHFIGHCVKFLHTVGSVAVAQVNTQAAVRVFFLEVAAHIVQGRDTNAAAHHHQVGVHIREALAVRAL